MQRSRAGFSEADSMPADRIGAAACPLGDISNILWSECRQLEAAQAKALRLAVACQKLEMNQQEKRLLNSSGALVFLPSKHFEGLYENTGQHKPQSSEQRKALIPLAKSISDEV